MTAFSTTVTNKTDDLLDLQFYPQMLINVQVIKVPFEISDKSLKKYIIDKKYKHLRNVLSLCNANFFSEYWHKDYSIKFEIFVLVQTKIFARIRAKFSVDTLMKTLPKNYFIFQNLRQEYLFCLTLNR